MSMDIFKRVSDRVETDGLTITTADLSRPWGGFFVIDEQDAKKFASLYFPDLTFESLCKGNKLSPKILLVKPRQRLSWQYHHRRAEIWRVIQGEAGVVTSSTDAEAPLQKLSVGESISLQQGERHRLVGLEDWGVIAEIWQHTDPDNPSDEDDIVRLQDDYGR